MTKPKYQSIEHDLLNKIQQQIYPKGTLIPTELELADQYCVSRPTVRQAVQSLVDQGYLEKRKKRGTIVRQNKIAQEFTHVIESYNQEMGTKGINPITKVLHVGIEQPSREIQKNLGLKPTDQVFRLVRLRFADKEPNVFVTSYIPATTVQNFLDVDFSQKSLYELMAQNNVAVTHVHRKLETQAADETIADLLNIAVGDPIFYFHTKGYTDSGRVVEYSIAKYRGDTNYFVFDLKR
ncbi:GntR family transcriptional regulator [Lacticaseibacillus chiayiensis]|uniref:GntR family transcriptional regulator n=1 Tax=Lacticaseibacillus chiayiensis TaxID=2100821 RepID=UPI0010104DB2|nr:GntR family transcriptional regulator [Lacticaseibacillus chiayiensis]RXT58468.1 transcriptional regulator [Lacticaseibacillus chiayiensis]